MAFDTKFIMQVFGPKIVSKAMQSFDRATTVVVISCWCAAFVVMSAAVYTITISVAAHRAADAALAAEPVLPKIAHAPMDIKSAQNMFDRMQHRFADVTFSVRGTNLGVTSSNGSRFHQWLAALSYIDTISPQLHWSFQEFCVGECTNAELMHAVLKGERVSFEAPKDDSKN